MLVLALDTTTRAGSLALLRDETLLATDSGDPLRTHGERLPGEISRLLERQGVALSEIDLFAVAAGPGSFTGLRIGIATMQGLAFANAKGLVGVSTLDALALTGAREVARQADDQGVPATIAVWMDARRQEVFAALYSGVDLRCLDGPVVGSPEGILKSWSANQNLDDQPVWFVGDGAIAYRAVIQGATRTQNLEPGTQNRLVLDPLPLTAPAIAILAAREAAAGRVSAPHAVRPIYVRRPDVELARERMNIQVDR